MTPGSLRLWDCPGYPTQRSSDLIKLNIQAEYPFNSFGEITGWLRRKDFECIQSMSAIQVMKVQKRTENDGYSQDVMHL